MWKMVQFFKFGMEDLANKLDNAANAVDAKIARVTAKVTCGGSCSEGCSPSSGHMDGVFSDGTGNYGNREDCWWLIAAPGAEITVKFPEFHTEQNYDFVSIYDCNCEESKKRILHHSGTLGSSYKYTSSTGYLKVTFKSDGSVVKSGFIGEWSIESKSTRNAISTASSIICYAHTSCGDEDDEDKARGLAKLDAPKRSMLMIKPQMAASGEQNNLGCDYLDPFGEGYRGTVNVAASGSACLPWPKEWVLLHHGGGLAKDPSVCSGIPSDTKCWEACVAQLEVTKNTLMRICASLHDMSSSRA